eukprot:1031095-Rhodomonas_salina.1
MQCLQWDAEKARITNFADLGIKVLRPCGLRVDGCKASSPRRRARPSVAGAPHTGSACSSAGGERFFSAEGS